MYVHVSDWGVRGGDKGIAPGTPLSPLRRGRGRKWWPAELRATELLGTVEAQPLGDLWRTAQADWGRSGRDPRSASGTLPPSVRRGRGCRWPTELLEKKLLVPVGALVLSATAGGPRPVSGHRPRLERASSSKSPTR